MQLEAIPKRFINPINGGYFRLSGFANYKQPATTRTYGEGENNARAMGHYTAVCLRKFGTWETYDDFSNKVEKKKRLVNPHILVYVDEKLI